MSNQLPDLRPTPITDSLVKAVGRALALRVEIKLAREPFDAVGIYVRDEGEFQELHKYEALHGLTFADPDFDPKTGKLVFPGNWNRELWTSVDACISRELYFRRKRSAREEIALARTALSAAEEIADIMGQLKVHVHSETDRECAMALLKAAKRTVEKYEATVEQAKHPELAGRQSGATTSLIRRLLALNLSRDQILLVLRSIGQYSGYAPLHAIATHRRRLSTAINQIRKKGISDEG